MLKRHSVRAKARSLSFRRKTVTIYVPVTNHIYFDGLSYRVRISSDGYCNSKNFRSHKSAVKYRNQLLRMTYMQ